MKVFPGIELETDLTSLKIFLQTPLPPPVHESQPQPSSGIPPFPLQLPSAEPESLGYDQIEGEDSLKARADGKVGGKDKMEPKCEYSTLKTQRAGTGVEAPE